MSVYIRFKFSVTCFVYLLLYFRACHPIKIHARMNSTKKVHFDHHRAKLKFLNTKNVHFGHYSAKLKFPDNGIHDIGFHLTEDEILKYKIWNRGNIFYYIDDFSFDKVLRDRIRKYFDEVNDATSLQFLELPQPPEDNSARWVLFINRVGQLDCVDYTTKSFTNSGIQRVVLGYDCLGAGGGALAAMVLALAGVPPQHNAPDRDKHIEILTENIIPEKKYLFEILSQQDWLFHDISYDFNSAGHYDLHKYTRNGAATIKIKDNVDLTIGQAEGLSNIDIIKIKMLYSYITKHSDANFAGCSKLYRPAANFDSYKPNVEQKKPGHKHKNYFAKGKNGNEESGIPIIENESFDSKKDRQEDDKNAETINNLKDAKRRRPPSGVKRLKHRVVEKKKYLFNYKPDYNTDEEK